MISERKFDRTSNQKAEKKNTSYGHTYVLRF